MLFFFFNTNITQMPGTNSGKTPSGSSQMYPVDKQRVIKLPLGLSGEARKNWEDNPCYCCCRRRGKKRRKKNPTNFQVLFINPQSSTTRGTSGRSPLMPVTGGVFRWCFRPVANTVATCIGMERKEESEGVFLLLSWPESHLVYASSNPAEIKISPAARSSVHTLQVRHPETAAWPGHLVSPESPSRKLVIRMGTTAGWSPPAPGSSGTGCFRAGQ